MIKKIVLIGNGSHAKKRIIPSIRKKKIKIQNIYTKKKSIFKISNLNLDDKFLFYYICTPPNTHYKIINFFLKKNKNVIVEKPALLNLYEFKKIKKIVTKNNQNIFIENLMYRYSKIFSRLNKYWLNNSKKVSRIEINFLIPNFFKIGFRSNLNDKYLILYDIGIYPISLINILGIKITKIKIINKNIIKNKIKILIFKLISDKLEILINIGEDLNYSNNIMFEEKNNFKIIFDKIFSGIKIRKKITRVSNLKKNTIFINDYNCFEKFFH